MLQQAKIQHKQALDKIMHFCCFEKCNILSIFSVERNQYFSHFVHLELSAFSTKDTPVRKSQVFQPGQTGLLAGLRVVVGVGKSQSQSTDFVLLEAIIIVYNQQRLKQTMIPSS